jgi:hypothetical protein
MQWLSNIKARYGWLTLMRSAAFGLALISLLIGARNGTPRGTLLLLFGLYIVAATVWVRGQYAESLEDETGTHTVPKVETSAMFAVVGFVLVVLGLVHHLGLDWLDAHTGGVALTGVVIGYFGIGGLITAWRAQQHAQAGNPVAVEILLGAGLAALILGAAVLGHWNFVVSVALLGAAVLLLFPIGLQLASARAIDRLTAPSKHWQLGLGFGGLGVFLLATIVASWRAHSTLLIGACLTLGLAVAAIASATQADIAAVFAVVAVIGVTPYQPALPDTLMPQTFPQHDKAHVAQILVALGDSYMSGEGASVYYSGTDEANGDQCRRSPTSWAAMAGQQPPFDGLAFLACSGASTFNVNDSGLDGLPQPSAQDGEGVTQLSHWNDLKDPLKFSPKLVVVTLGGNDAGFGVIGQMCLAPGSCAERGDLWPTSLPQVRHALEHTYDRIAATFPATPVLVIGYPDPIADTPRCGQLALTGTERAFVKAFVTALDSTIKDAATSRHFYYLDTSLQTLALAHLQLCDPRNDGQPGLNFIGLRSMRGNPEQRFNPQNWIHNSLHPNERGHQAILRAFEAWWAKNTKLTPLTPRTSAAPIAPDPPAVATAQAPNPPCDITTAVPHNCKREGQRWALQQVGDMLIPKGLIFGLLVVGGAWAASVGLFGWRRHEGEGWPFTGVTPTEPNASTSSTAEAEDESPGGVTVTGG